MSLNVENRYELWKVDEYGQGAIMDNGTDYEVLLDKAKDLVHTDNIENALAGAEKLKNWDSYLVEVLDDNGEKIDNAVYAGKSNSGRHQVQLITDGEVEQALLEDVDVNVRIYIGRDDRGVVNRGTADERRLVDEIFATDMKRVREDDGSVKVHEELVSDLSDRTLQGKTAYFVRKVRTSYSPV